MNRTQALCVELGQLDHKEAAECGPLMWSTDEEGTPRNRCVCVCIHVHSCLIWGGGCIMGSEVQVKLLWARKSWPPSYSSL